MTTLTDIGALKEAQAGIGLSESIYRIAGAGYTKGLYWDVMMGRLLVPANVSRLTARGRLLAELSTYAPSFYAELSHTAVPTIAAPGTTATFTRATTKTVENNDGYLVTLLAGEIGFPGARRVRNLLPSSENFSPASWDKNSLTVVSQSSTFDVSGGISADLLYPSTSGSGRFVYAVGVSSGLALNTVQANSVYAKAAGVSWIALRHENAADISSYCWFNLATGVIGTTEAGITADIEDCGDGVYRCSIVRSRGASGSGGANAYLIEFCDGDNTHTVTASGTNGVLLGGAQFEDVTAQTTQTAGEYVSVGVESAPYYHGSFVDGVACFDYYYLD